jgi:endonuclease YncB( thermonuclease family)
LAPLSSSLPGGGDTGGLLQPFNPSKFSAKIVSITDRDTVDVLGPGGPSYAVRLAGIDAPEHGQPFGTESP